MPPNEKIRAADVLGERAWESLSGRSRWLRLAARLEEGPRDAPTAEEAADLAGLSLSYCSKEFRTLTGWSWGHFVRAWRMHEARRIRQRDPQLKLAALARRVGYESVTAFARAFAEFHGETVRGARSSQVSRAIGHGVGGKRPLGSGLANK